MADLEKEYKRLRSYLNPYMKGPTVDAVLHALATNSAYLIDNVTAVNDNLYVVTASGKYLDERLSEAGITRPPAVGLSDDIFREIGIEVKNRKQVRDLINNLLNAMFGDQFVKAFISSQVVEPYNLSDGDTLKILIDDKTNAEIQFLTSQFQNISAATAQEVADVITKTLRAQGLTGTAIAKDDGNGPYVQILSDTIGPASSVAILGGRAQNEMIFPQAVPAGGNMSTQWTLSLQSGSKIRLTWSGGANPQLGKVSVGNYANIYGGGFGSSPNEGSYIITKVQGGDVNVAYFEIYNPLGTSGIVVQGTDDAVLFFNPIRQTVTSQTSYAVAFQTSSRVLQIFMPAATKVVRRGREGSAHLHDQADPQSLLPNQEGPYVYDTAQPFTVSSVFTTLNQSLDGTMPRIISVSDASQFPDEPGFFMLNYGYSNQEGPIPYIARPSNTSILISPTYTIKNVHASGSDLSLVAAKNPVDIAKDGTDYPFYITDTVSGRVYAQDLINQIAAAGITVIYTIMYPGDEGLGKWGTEYSENPSIWS